MRAVLAVPHTACARQSCREGLLPTLTSPKPPATASHPGAHHGQ